MKKIYITIVISITYITLLALLIGSSDAMLGECTKFDVIKLVDKGFTKQQIEKVCNDSVNIEDTMCCCEIKNFQFVSIPIPFTIEQETGFPFTKWEWLPESTRYEWVESGQCLSQSEKEKFLARSDWPFFQASGPGLYETSPKSRGFLIIKPATAMAWIK